MMAPHVLDHVENNDGEVIRGTTLEPHEYRSAMQPQTAATVRDLMIDVVNNGTGTRAQIPGVQVAGKTGTAQVRRASRARVVHRFRAGRRTAVRDRGARRERRRTVGGVTTPPAVASPRPSRPQVLGGLVEPVTR